MTLSIAVRHTRYAGDRERDVTTFLPYLEGETVEELVARAGLAAEDPPYRKGLDPTHRIELAVLFETEEGII